MTYASNKKLVLSVIVAAAFAGGYALHDQYGMGARASTLIDDAIPQSVVPQTARQATALPSRVALPDFSAIVESQGPAVVNISTSGTTRTAAMEFPGFDPDGPFGEFFKRFGVPGPNGRMMPPQRVPTRGLGSGFIVNPDGVILTNAHVVADADEVIVKLTDKREFKARVVGIDRQTDVAVLRIDAKNLPTVKIGDPANVRVGEWVMAIGSPFGFENSVTAGIVSAKSRALPDEGYVPFMQTDVAVNPGNSGGPLLNASGEVIGINSQIYSQSGGYQGLSFAIPIDVAMNVEQQLLAHGKVSRGRLGVTVQEVDQGLADSFGLDKPRGALVDSVDTAGPAAKAGIEAGDIILKFDGKEISRSSELPVLVGAATPGSKAKVEIWRKGRTRELGITLGEMSNEKVASDDADATDETGGKLGLAVRPLTGDERAQVAGGHGLVVENVDDGPAARAGIRPGDVIVSANGEQVNSVDQLKKQLGHAGKRIALLVRRGEQQMFVAVAVG
ncbi:MAG: DegQ family serine endoprotease [Gammaproteobacteria bacterium]|nr:DegQ family serine endoprotease [Gammaproteobacteria bacterium]MBU1414662.1 DegQ family serine endoprotease [Gammaproteobacteria bacterium]